ncbi:MAG: hypothetical protein FWE59_04315 [Oscillospiraceae bacterium]|nr:hypothetical protein [Oscillospiraceae bacterium]
MLSFEERINEIYKKYINVICPYILQYELLDTTFPIEILNEIRAVFTHFAKCHLSEKAVQKEKKSIKSGRAYKACYT